MKTIKPLQPTLLNYETAKMIHELEIELRRCTHGVARQGRLWKVTDYDYQTGKFHVIDHDGNRQTWNKTKTACYFA